MCLCLIWRHSNYFKYFSLCCPGLRSSRYRAVGCGCGCSPHIMEIAVPALFSNTPSVSRLLSFFGREIFHCHFHLSRYDGLCALPLLCTFYTKAVREGKSSALMREVTVIQKGNTSMTHGTIEPTMLHKHCTHIFYDLL